MDEQLKQKLMLALVAFNLTVIGYMIGTMVFGRPLLGIGPFFIRFLTGAGIGIVVAGIVFGAASAMKK